jgi:predicted nucleic acid-binding protein
VNHRTTVRKDKLRIGTAERDRTYSELVLVDSSGWIEFLGDGPLANKFAPYFEHGVRLIVPEIVLYDIYKKLLTVRGSAAADRFLSAAFRARGVPVDERLAIFAARMSIEHRLAMADAMIYATAVVAGAQLFTSDSHFQGLPEATVF